VSAGAGVRTQLSRLPAPCHIGRAARARLTSELAELHAAFRPLLAGDESPAAVAFCAEVLLRAMPRRRLAR